MNTKHTPGPWRTTGKRNENGMFRVYADGNGQIGAAYTYAEGDAALIAAAPDLLAALCALLAAIDCGGHEEVVDASNPLCVKSARAAIVKATGVQS